MGVNEFHCLKKDMYILYKRYTWKDRYEIYKFRFYRYFKRSGCRKAKFTPVNAKYSFEEKFSETQFQNYINDGIIKLICEGGI